MKIKPRAKQVLVKVDPEKSRKSKHGLYTPSNVDQERKSFGTVIAVGSEIKDIKKGDKVLYGAYAGEKLNLDESKDFDHVLLFDEDVLAFIQ